MNRILFGLALLAAALVTAVPAHAATDAYTTAAVNMRSGPGVRYAPVAVVPAGRAVTVYGCLPNRSWCDVQWRRHRGWVSSRYLRHAGVHRPLYAPGYISPPSIYFDFNVYHNRWYRDRPYYRHYNGRPWRRRRNP